MSGGPERTATDAEGPSSLVTLMGTALPGARGAAAPEDAPLATGTVVDRYVVLSELGRGGMGVIYEAYDPELDRRIALKLLRSSSKDPTDTKGPRARLLREAQALARVTHPNVVTVHDVGTHERDVFVAMELVEGGTLESWCKDEPRSWRDVLELLCLAGEGLRAAHDHGVVHRDFKPANVLIGTDGRVRVADFGLARAAEDGPERSSLSLRMGPSVSTTTGEPILDLSANLTRTGAILGTPAYMAPEQHRGRQGDVRADIFSFCVTAYEALYGRRPFEGETAAVYTGNVVRGEVLDPPGDVVLPTPIHQAIVRGLSVDPRKRPQTMAELLQALRPEPPRVTRRRGLAITVLLGMVGIGYAIGTSGEDPCAIGPERFAGIWDDEHRRTLGEAFAATERSFSDDLRVRVEAGLDRYASRWLDEARAICEATHVHGLQSEARLDLRMECLDRRADALRVTVRTLEDGDAELLVQGADIVRGLPGLHSCEDAEALRRAALPDDPDARAEAAEIRDRLARARALRDGGHITDALPLAEDAASRARTLGHPPLLAESLLLLSDVHEAADRPKDARVEVEQALAAAIEAGDDRLAAEVAVAAIYTVGYKLSDVAGAEGWDRQAQGWIARLGHPERLEARRLDARSIVYLEAERHEEAMADLERVQQIYDRVLEPDHPSRGTTQSHIGDALIALGRYEDAVARYRRAVALYEEAYGSDHPNLIPALNNLGVSLMDLGRFDEARALFERTLGLAEASTGSQSRSYALALRNLSDVDRQEGKHQDAIDRARRALEIYQGTDGGTDKGTVTALSSLAISLATAKQFEEATEYFRRVHEAQVEMFGADSLKAVFAENNLGTVLADQGRYEEGLVHLRRALADKERLLGKDHPALVSTLSAIGESSSQLDDCEGALPLFERAEAIQREATGDQHPGVANALLGRGTCAMELGDPEAALPLLERALEIRSGAGLAPALVARARFAVARAAWKTGARDRARRLAEQALAELTGASEGADDELAEVRAWLDRPS